MHHIFIEKTCTVIKIVTPKEVSQLCARITKNLTWPVTILLSNLPSDPRLLVATQMDSLHLCLYYSNLFPHGDLFCSSVFIFLEYKCQSCLCCTSPSGFAESHLLPCALENVSAKAKYQRETVGVGFVNMKNLFFHYKCIIMKLKYHFYFCKLSLRQEIRKRKPPLEKWQNGWIYFFFQIFWHTVILQTPKQMVTEVTIVTKPWSVKDFSRSGDYVLHAAEKKPWLHSTFEYFNLHFALKEKPKLRGNTMGRIAFVLWSGYWSTITLLP